ncbi:MAG TPA: hypothetical protein VLJ59_03705 [Mycobacteriales bacterium]|nr:hypothetical protein [Mycobacteriales bacterium]
MIGAPSTLAAPRALVTHDWPGWDGPEWNAPEMRPLPASRFAPVQEINIKLDNRAAHHYDDLTTLVEAQLRSSGDPLSIVSDPTDLADRAALLWGLLAIVRDLLAAPDAAPWTFSTFEARHDGGVRKVPRVVFVPRGLARDRHFSVNRQVVYLPEPPEPPDGCRRAAELLVSTYVHDGGGPAVAALLRQHDLLRPDVPAARVARLIEIVGGPVEVPAKPILGSNPSSAGWGTGPRTPLVPEPDLPNLSTTARPSSPQVDTVALTPVALTPVASTPVASTPVASTPVPLAPLTGRMLKDVSDLELVDLLGVGQPVAPATVLAEIYRRRVAEEETRPRVRERLLGHGFWYRELLALPPSLALSPFDFRRAMYDLVWFGYGPGAFADPQVVAVVVEALESEETPAAIVDAFVDYAVHQQVYDRILPAVGLRRLRERFPLLVRPSAKETQPDPLDGQPGRKIRWFDRPEVAPNAIRVMSVVILVLLIIVVVKW